MISPALGRRYAVGLRMANAAGSVVDKDAFAGVRDSPHAVIFYTADPSFVAAVAFP